MQSRLNQLNYRLERLANRLKRLEELGQRWANYRLAVFVGGAALVFGSLYWRYSGLTLILLIGGLVAFSLVVRCHRRIEAALAQFAAWHQILLEDAARLKLDWENMPNPAATSGPQNPGEADHPFDNDLDITGPRSLLRLIDTAATLQGSNRLRQRLRQTVPVYSNVVACQALVREMTPLARFRNRLRLAFNLVSRHPFDGAQLVAWLKQETAADMTAFIHFMVVFGLLNLGLAIGTMAGLPGRYAGLSLLLYSVIYFWRLLTQGDFLAEALQLGDSLQKVQAALLHLERHPIPPAGPLARLLEPLRNSPDRPSTQLQQIQRITAAIGLRMNPVFQILLNIFTPWDFYWVQQLHRARAGLAQALPAWLEILYEVETTAALANLADLNPSYTFPVLHNNGVLFKAAAISHPLLPAERKICNDFSFEKLGQIVLITGSNMAGKSTFLRTLGVNLTLAYAGGPVNAASLELTLFRPFACIRVTDSIADGFSYFYAEVRRLKALLEALHKPDAPPLFFLIDEIFKGTNNRERLIGSRSYIMALAQAACGLGLVTTHDLELIHLAQTVPMLRNCHFREEVAAGRMIFDYQIRSGPCPTTNALKIMALEGLPINGHME